MTTRPNAARTFPAQSLFFPAAVLHALLVVPLSVLANTGTGGALPGLVGGGHAREMLSGFALALVAGYTLGPITARQALPLFGAWLAARVVTVLHHAPAASAGLDLLFGLLLAGVVLPRFWPARRWRNRMLIPLLGSISLLPGLWGLALLESAAPIGRDAGAIGVVLLALLMLFMGGRLIAPAAAGDYYGRGRNLENRVQPRLEGSLLLLLPAAALLLLFGLPRLAGALLLPAALLAAVRLWRWRLWECRGRSDLHGLGLGYAWLVLGLLALGSALLAGAYRPALLHLITIGALGTLSTGVVARWHYQRRGHRLPPRGFVYVTVAAFAIAALARAAAPFFPDAALALLWIAVAGWETGYLATGALLARGLLARAPHGGPSR